MSWEKIGDFFTLEAVATYLVALVTAAYWIYRWRKSRKGRHVVCTRSQVFSHLRLSDTARELVEVRFTKDGQLIHELSQVLIEIRNESDTDALNDVKLKFRLPDARLLEVWWEYGPEYLLEDARVDASVVDSSSSGEAQTHNCPSIIQVYLPHLKSFTRYKEAVCLGVLANGDLETIKMVPAGSRGHVPEAQTWTAKFSSYPEIQQRIAALRAANYGVLVALVIVIPLGFVSWLVGQKSGDVNAFTWGLFAGGLWGFSGVGILSYILNLIRLRNIARGREQAQKVGPQAEQPELGL